MRQIYSTILLSPGEAGLEESVQGEVFAPPQEQRLADPENGEDVAEYEGYDPNHSGRGHGLHVDLARCQLNTYSLIETLLSSAEAFLPEYHGEYKHAFISRRILTILT